MARNIANSTALEQSNTFPSIYNLHYNPILSQYQNSVQNRLISITPHNNNPRLIQQNFDFVPYTSTNTFPLNYSSVQPTSTSDLFLKGDAFLHSGYTEQALKVYTKAIIQSGQDICPQRLKILKMHTDMISSKYPTKKNNKHHINNNETQNMFLECYVCQSLYTNPVTSFCGHTFCKVCCEDFSICILCKVKCELCPSKEGIKTNLLISRIIDKLMGKWQDVVVMKKKAVTLYQQKSWNECKSFIDDCLTKETLDLFLLNLKVKCLHHTNILEAYNLNNYILHLHPENIQVNRVKRNIVDVNYEMFYKKTKLYPMKYEYIRSVKPYFPFSKGSAYTQQLNDDHHRKNNSNNCPDNDPDHVDKELCLIEPYLKSLPLVKKHIQTQRSLSRIVNQIRPRPCQSSSSSSSSLPTPLSPSSSPPHKRPSFNSDSHNNTINNNNNSNNNTINNNDNSNNNTINNNTSNNSNNASILYNNTNNNSNKFDTDCKINNLCHNLHHIIYVEMSKNMKISQNSRLEEGLRMVLSSEDLECSLCLSVLFKPLSTPCGHVFCMECFYRALDHSPYCPLCKLPLSQYLSDRPQFTTLDLQELVEVFFPEKFEEKKKTQIFKISNASCLQKGENIPIFVCTIAFPSISCPLHIFEPRYRLMMRRCLESDFKQFGMCRTVDGNGVIVGTMLEIISSRNLPDGRLLVNTVGRRRFRVKKLGSTDGYNQASVEFFKDDPLAIDEIDELCIKLKNLYIRCKKWLQSLPQQKQRSISNNLGVFPPYHTGLSYNFVYEESPCGSGANGSRCGLGSNDGSAGSSGEGGGGSCSSSSSSRGGESSCGIVKSNASPTTFLLNFNVSLSSSFSIQLQQQRLQQEKLHIQQLQKLQQQRCIQPNHPQPQKTNSQTNINLLPSNLALDMKPTTKIQFDDDSKPVWLWYVVAMMPFDDRTKLKVVATTNINFRIDAINQILNIIADQNWE